MPLILVMIGIAFQYLLGLTKNLSVKNEVKQLKKELSEISLLQSKEHADTVE
ncbi:TPA: hypothetical protein ACGOVN_000357 [Streptococcus suis]